VNEKGNAQQKKQQAADNVKKWSTDTQ
jgi:hypothetical protein